VIVELGDQDVGQQPRAGHAARDRAARRRLLRDLLAAPAGLLQPRDLKDLQLRRDHVEDLADVLADKAQLAAAVGAAGARVELPALARGGVRDTRAAPRLALWRLFGGGGRRRLGRILVRILVHGLGGAFSRRDQHVLQRQLELFDLALDLLGGFAEDHLRHTTDAVYEGGVSPSRRPQPGGYIASLTGSPDAARPCLRSRARPMRRRRSRCSGRNAGEEKRGVA
jgi:hypothetical protein